MNQSEMDRMLHPVSCRNCGRLAGPGRLRRVQWTVETAHCVVAVGLTRSLDDTRWCTLSTEARFERTRMKGEA